jgi:hypothetical protein
LRRPRETAAGSRRSSAISCKASAYFVNSLATHVRAALSSHALIALWASRETDSTVRRPGAAPAAAEPAVGDADRPSKDCADAEIGPTAAADRARATARPIGGGKCQERLKPLSSISGRPSLRMIENSRATGNGDVNAARAQRLRRPRRQSRKLAMGRRFLCLTSAFSIPACKARSSTRPAITSGAGSPNSPGWTPRPSTRRGWRRPPPYEALESRSARPILIASSIINSRATGRSRLSRRR